VNAPRAAHADADSTRPSHRAEGRCNVDRAANVGRLTFALNMTLGPPRSSGSG
jgi:hypothetical protein